MNNYKHTNLTTNQALNKLKQNGKNQLIKAKKKNVFALFLSQLANPMIVVLIVSAIFSYIISLYSKEGISDVIIILTVVFLNSLLGVIQEAKAEKAINALNDLTPKKSKIIRDNEIKFILSEDLFNIELNIDELDINEVYNIVIERLSLTEQLTPEIKEKIYNYIKLSYGSSELKNTEYAKVLFNKIILNEKSTFDENKNKVLELEDIPNLYNTRDLPQILSELNEMIGLGKIKKQINNLVSLLKFNKRANIDISKFNLHMVFTGNPGTGKTTVARIFSDILYNLGYTKKNKLVEVSAKDLIAEYVGQTAGKTYNVLKSAFGGVLFIDEAYSIVESGSNASFASDCMTTILKVLEDQKDNLIVIFAGYEKQMEKFIKFNPGLKSRIGYTIKFDDYTSQELIDIFKQLVEKNNLKITDEALKKVEGIIETSKKVEDFGNARYINQIYQDILIEHSRNVENIENDENLMVITEDDIDAEKLTAKNEARRIGF